jgi:hypothetical protein
MVEDSSLLSASALRKSQTGRSKETNASSGSRVVTRPRMCGPVLLPQAIDIFVYCSMGKGRTALSHRLPSCTPLTWRFAWPVRGTAVRHRPARRLLRRPIRCRRTSMVPIHPPAFNARTRRKYLPTRGEACHPHDVPFRASCRGRLHSNSGSKEPRAITLARPGLGAAPNFAITARNSTRSDAQSDTGLGLPMGPKATRVSVAPKHLRTTAERRVH